MAKACIDICLFLNKKLPIIDRNLNLDVHHLLSQSMFIVYLTVEIFIFQHNHPINFQSPTSAIMIDLQTFAVMNLSSALDLIIDTLQQPDLNNEDGDKEQHAMYDEELEDLLISFIEDIFELISVVVEDTSVKMYAKMQSTKENLIWNVKAQVGSQLLLACSMLLSFLSAWVRMLQISGMTTANLRAGLRLTVTLVSTLQTANQQYVRRKSQWKRSRSKSVSV